MLVGEKDNWWRVGCYTCGSHLIPRDSHWTFNGNFQNPSFSPSMNETVNWPNSPYYQADHKSVRCHFIIKDGHITYCADCTHELAGQTLPMMDF